MSAPFAAGEKALFIDPRGRRYLITLAVGRQFHSHLGTVAHDDLIGAQDGSELKASSGARLRAFRPTLADFVLKMQRGAQVIYPKDVALIATYADIFPGAKVLEAGSGSGSLTLGLARAVGPEGMVVSYELREDHLERAVANVASWYGAIPPQVELRRGDVFEGVPEPDFDRIVLDLPEPWRAVPQTTSRLAAGGIFCCYLPTIPQVQRTVEAVRGAGFVLVNTFEALVRTWNVDGPSVRPDHRMVAHTGFIITARKPTLQTDSME
ncbi:MAG: tRNA (adenine-N1)-methyltransferase [Actinomycetota bacterium]|nr:tRNA (adenine-N1)-methyltransferase [Actinomycetota bacterium]